MTYDDYLTQYWWLEPKLLADPTVQKELEDTGMVRSAVIQRVLGLDQGMTNFVSREFHKRHYNAARAAEVEAAQKKIDNEDEYYYHITLKTRLSRIKKMGLVPGSDAVFTNYGANSKGRIFLCEKGGVRYWKDAVEDHEMSNTDRPRGVVVLRILKQRLGQEVHLDRVGTEDARSPAYYVTRAIYPTLISVV